jgi:hypothetical protein
MNPALILIVILAALLATLPVRKLHQADWTSGALFTAWFIYVALMVTGLDVGAGAKYLLPVLIVLFALPYVVGQARLAKVGRLFGGRRTAAARPVINVTPPGGPGVAAPVDEPVEPAEKRRGRKPPVEYR